MNDVEMNYDNTIRQLWLNPVFGEATEAAHVRHKRPLRDVLSPKTQRSGITL